LTWANSRLSRISSSSLAVPLATESLGAVLLDIFLPAPQQVLPDTQVAGHTSNRLSGVGSQLNGFSFEFGRILPPGSFF